MLVPIVPIYSYSPDRMPTPAPSRNTSLTAATAAADAGSESPKRKHAQAMTVQERVPALSVNVPSMVNDNSAPEGHCNSPRSRVAERLEALDIDRSEDAPRKRAKFTQSTHERGAVGLGLTPVQTNHQPADSQTYASRPVLEIQETPGCRPEEAARSPTPSPLAKQSKPSTSPVMSAKPKVSPKRMRSPPPLTTTSDALSGSSQDSEKDATRAGAMTWQASEITGHEIDPSIDDDGEGINGVGFRPTPAIAHARTQKRKQQVSAWRAREAREARQRRFEKRQGCSVDASAGDESQRRVVRFEGVG